MSSAINEKNGNNFVNIPSPLQEKADRLIIQNKDFGEISCPFEFDIHIEERLFITRPCISRFRWIHCKTNKEIIS